MYRPIPQNNYLYHYTSPSALIDIMKSKSLKFNYYKYMNDPKESKYWSCSIKDSDEKKYLFEANQNVKYQNVNQYSNFNYDRIKPFNDMKMKIQVLSFTTDNPDYKTGIKNDNCYIGRGFGNPYFWAHYGNSHKNICIQFNKEKIEAQYEKLQVDYKFAGRHINYNDELFEGNPSFINFIDLSTKKIDQIVKDCIFEHQDYYLFSKTTFWNAEREYRLAIYNEIQEFKYLKICDCISSIIIGEDISKEDELSVLSAALKNKTSVAKMSWGNGYPTAETISYDESIYD